MSSTKETEAALVPEEDDEYEVVSMFAEAPERRMPSSLSVPSARCQTGDEDLKKSSGDPMVELASECFSEWQKKHDIKRSYNITHKEYLHHVRLKLPGTLDFRFLLYKDSSKSSLDRLAFTNGSHRLPGFQDDLNLIQHAWLTTSLPPMAVQELIFCLPGPKIKLQDAIEKEFEAYVYESDALKNKNSIKVGLGTISQEDCERIFDCMDLLRDVDSKQKLPVHFKEAFITVGDRQRGVGLNLEQFQRLFKQSQRNLEYILVKELEKLYRNNSNFYVIDHYSWFKRWRAHVCWKVDVEKEAPWAEYTFPRPLCNQKLSQKLQSIPTSDVKAYLEERFGRPKSAGQKTVGYHQAITVTQQAWDVLRSIHGGGPAVVIRNEEAIKKSPHSGSRMAVRHIFDLDNGEEVEWEVQGWVVNKEISSQHGWALHARITGILDFGPDKKAVDKDIGRVEAFLKCASTNGATPDIFMRGLQFVGSCHNVSNRLILRTQYAHNELVAQGSPRGRWYMQGDLKEAIKSGKNAFSNSSDAARIFVFQSTLTTFGDRVILAFGPQMPQKRFEFYKLVKRIQKHTECRFTFRGGRSPIGFSIQVPPSFLNREDDRSAADAEDNVY